MVQGERDPFGTPEEFPPLTEMAVVPGAEHAFKVPKRAELTSRGAVYDVLVESRRVEWVEPRGMSGWCVDGLTGVGAVHERPGDARPRPAPCCEQA